MSETRTHRRALYRDSAPDLPDGAAIVLCLAACLLMLPLVGLAWMVGQPAWLLCTLWLFGGPALLVGLLAARLVGRSALGRLRDLTREYRDV